MSDKINTTEKKENQSDWPNTIHSRDELDSALEAGLKSGVSKRSIDEIFESGIAKAKNG